MLKFHLLKNDLYFEFPAKSFNYPSVAIDGAFKGNYYFFCFLLLSFISINGI